MKPPSRHTTSPASIPGPRDDLCLDFANTLSWRGSATPSEALAEPQDLLDWLERSGYRAPEGTVAWSIRHPKRAARWFAESIGLREAIFRCAFALAGGNAVPAADFAALNAALAVAPARQCLVHDAGRYAWQAPEDEQEAAIALAPVLWSAADLLVSAGHPRLRHCANDACLWLFIDRSKTGTRRWCDMAACGNRAKAQRHYRRHAPA